tara:strand:- start:99 stop:659 length:561 start_codon:yes stop_codon:yes gene_type:complete
MWAEGVASTAFLAPHGADPSGPVAPAQADVNDTIAALGFDLDLEGVVGKLTNVADEVHGASDLLSLSTAKKPRSQRTQSRASPHIAGKAAVRSSDARAMMPPPPPPARTIGKRVQVKVLAHATKQHLVARTFGLNSDKKKEILPIAYAANRFRAIESVLDAVALPLPGIARDATFTGNASLMDLFE